MKQGILLFCALAVGFGLGALTYCKYGGGGRKITMTVIDGLPDKAPAPIIHQGDVLKWQTADGNGVNVRFQYSSPCSEGVNTYIPTCTVNVAKYSYVYDCQGNTCADPEIPVGTDNTGLGGTGRPRAPKAVTPAGYQDPVQIYCDPSTNTAGAAPQTAQAGQSFHWFGVGPATSNWTVDGVGAGICQGGLTSFSPAASICTVQPGHGGTTTYNVHSPGCTNPNGTATLNIQ